MNIVVFGLSITSSWGNGHATTYRALIRALTRRGHTVRFFERDVSWYAQHRDLPKTQHAQTHLYTSLAELHSTAANAVHAADLVIVGSYVPEGVAVSEWVLEHAPGVTAFYDIDTPVTLAKLDAGDYEYTAPHVLKQFDLYLSFTGGQTLRTLESRWHARRAVPLYCAVDTELYHPQALPKHWDLGYLGTYSPDRQPPLEELMLNVARTDAGRFVVAGPQYPTEIEWPENVERFEHLPPAEHCAFYNQQRFTLNITRADMVRAGYAPSVRLFEAAACGVPIISDWWEGLDTFLEPDRQILIARCAEDTRRYLRDISEERRAAIGLAASDYIRRHHSADHRALELEQYWREASQKKPKAAIA